MASGNQTERTTTKVKRERPELVGRRRKHALRGHLLTRAQYLHLKRMGRAQEATQPLRGASPGQQVRPSGRVQEPVFFEAG